jgi:ribonucleoside-triphosphate reductase
MADGTSQSLKDLADGIYGESFEVYCINKEGNLTTKRAYYPRKTRKKASLVEVVLDNNSRFCCTPDHKVMLRDGSWCEAQNLQNKQSLMPCYTYKLPNGYVQHEWWDFSEKRRKKEYVHRIIAKQIYEVSDKEFVVHHRNGKKDDNRTQNLIVMDDKEHRSYEISQTRQTSVWKENNKKALQKRNTSFEARERSRKEMQCRWDKAKEDGNNGLYYRNPYNHKVKCVNKLNYTEDVYCISVPDVENFVLDVGVVVHNCAGHSLSNLLNDGIDSSIQSSTAKHFGSAVNHMVNYIGSCANDFAGAQAFNDVDLYLAPFAYKAYLDYKKTGCSRNIAFRLARRDVYQNIQSFIFHLNYNSRWGSQPPFSNVTLSITVPDDMKDQLALIGGKPLKEYYDYTRDGVRVNNHTHADLWEWQRLVAEAFLDTLIEGDAEGKSFTFPVLTLNVTDDFFDHPLVEKICELTAKFGYPFFQNFINGHSGGHKIDPGDTRSMCCRLSLDINEVAKHTGGLFGNADNTGSIQVITVCLPFLAMEARKNGLDFWQVLECVMDEIKMEQLWKRQIVEEQFESYFYPLAKQNFKKGFDGFFTTIGFIGLWECVEILTDNEESFLKEDGLELGKNVLTFMREKCDAYMRETGKLFNLEATPAEGATYKLAKKSLKNHPDIPFRGLKKAPYFTNSHHLPVEYQGELDLVFWTQNELQPIPSGGTVQHFTIGEKLSTEETKEVIKTICQTKIPYFSINTVFSFCPICGYLSGYHEECPNYHSKEDLEWLKSVKPWMIKDG